MNVLVPAKASRQFIAGVVPHKTVCILAGMALAMGGCGGFTPSMSVPDLRMTPNSDAFKNRFYAGASFGATSLSPDTQDAPAFRGGDATSGASQIRFGYDWHNRLALEFDSSVLGDTSFEQSDQTSIKYSSLGLSALFYGLTGNENRNRREKWSGYGRLGVALNRTASNITTLDRSETGLLFGAGVEYGMKNGLGIRGEVTRFNSEATYLGLGIVYRFNSVKRFVPENLGIVPEAPATVSSRFGTTVSGAGQESDTPTSMRTRLIADGQGEIPGDLNTPAVGKVRLLASSQDFDVDGVPNEEDKCRNTATGTAVGSDGCGLFDGTLANSTFSNGSAGLGSNIKSSLDNLVTRLIAFPEVRIAIEGHTDGKGPEDINMNVSRARAHMVRDYLIRQGVPAQQLETHAYGETRPIADNDTEQGRDQNRRIAFVTLPSLSRRELANPVVPAIIASTKKNKPVEQQIATAAQANGEEPVLGAARRGIDLLPATVSIPGLDVHQVMDNVAFQEKSAQLLPAGRSTITQVARVLQQHKHIKVMLAAHTNEMASEDENIALSNRQAQAVARELVRRGVNRRQLETRGFGSALPIVQEVSDADRAVNRRIELRPVRN